MNLSKEDFGKISAELAEILTPLDDISAWPIDEQLDYLKTAMINAQESAEIILDILDGVRSKEL
jgi:hypothetical protein